MSRPIILTSVGSTALRAHEEFDRLYKQEHGELPFWKRHKWMTSGWRDMENGAIQIEAPIGECPVTEEELHEYMRMRDEYIAEAVLQKHGWNEFTKYCAQAMIEDLIQKHTPCEADDGQCHMDCYLRGECRP